MHLQKLITDDRFSNLSSLIAKYTLFTHPNIVEQTKNENIFQIIRDLKNRGKISEYNGIMLMACDNTGPQHAFEWANGGIKKTDIQINHIYALSKDVKSYTSLANLCATPAFLAKLTDTDDEIKNLLRYRAFELYGYYIGSPPTKPENYQNLVWHKFMQGPSNLEKFFLQRIDECPKSRTALSVKELGWFFNSYTNANKISSF
ncbi:MAG: hypothetical protein JNL11_05110 [Bdellovibrionaceae bacterium]|nr:hypothetical protein [Pseudobdellovibrionaceae bacterium]